MKKFLAGLLAGILVVGTCTAVFAAPPTEEPSAVSVTQDGKNHSVYVFGTALALISTDGSIKISSIGPVGRVDVMMDGVVIKNVSSIDIPEGQRTRMALEEGSIVAKNVTEESGEDLKKQLEDIYATGAESVDLALLTDVTAYKVNADGKMENAEGNLVPANDPVASVSSVDAVVESFDNVMKEIAAEEAEVERQRAVEAQSSSNNNSSSSSSSSSGSSSPAPNTSAQPTQTTTPTQTTQPTQTTTPTQTTQPTQTTTPTQTTQPTQTTTPTE